MKTDNKYSILMQNLLEKEGVNIPKTGDVIEGKIIALKPSIIYLDLGNFKSGVILGSEIKKHPFEFRKIKLNDIITVKILSIDNEDGYVEVSLLKAGEEKAWQGLKEKMDKNEIIDALVTKANKGGLMIEVEGTEAFMPVSQLSSTHYPRVEGGDKTKILSELNKLVNQTLKVKIIDLNVREKKLIVSEKATEEKKLKIALEKYKIGDIVEGIITGIVDFGAFIKFEDLEGLIHISEMDWQIINNPNEIFNVGDKVKAQIIEIDKDRVSLSTRALKENPWTKVEDKYHVDQTVKGKVTKFNPFGAFVKIDKNIQGLTHISEFGTEKKMEETLEIGKEYDFKIISIKASEYRMALKPITE
ncbi:MAG TPA: S1 RNA-binding domain-containing protein [Candidatus Portnoybacteria bacterium]|jgi:small subunit ribosomal protein S1|nr:S1 RNA-binding domain-containing protein [Candidatus Portnoybacteria bacterium]MDD5752249.1 S1 RNA-binding domain-containing protein [Candidatus Portnoybacteria bacterium]HNU96748.1 S1 RNA-binding domain-containing protein [Candidatus Portnoybacteria bacterium]HOZ16530.1 S1 RNA-binding domain-containing protein [Candidatus Portnoybacteria bacterium]HPH52289.1 S1 RNA-binding domain-containing protein [Candidatus Portnoybacteria bacterium]